MVYRLTLSQSVTAALAIIAIGSVAPQIATFAFVALVFAATGSRPAAIAVALVACVVLTTTAAPAATALSADADIQWLVDGANKLKIGFILLAIAIAGLGVAFGAVHFATHRDQWFQSIQIIAGAFVAAAIMFHVDNIMRLAAAGALLR